MRDKEYASWLEPQVSDAVIINYIKRYQRVERDLNIDLDDEFVKDGGISLLEKMAYNVDDQRRNRPLRCEINFRDGSDLRTGMSSLKTAVERYFEFCEGDTAHTKCTLKNGAKEAGAGLLGVYSDFLSDCGIEVSKTKIKQNFIDTSAKIRTLKNEKSAVKDSYLEFLTHFGIDKDAFFEWGISSTIFPDVGKVASEWQALKKRIYGDQKVCIRGYGRDAHATQLYINFYKELLGNHCVTKDTTVMQPRAA